MSYAVEAVADPTAFALLVQPLIDAEPVDYSVLASNLAPFASGARACTDQSWFVVRSAGKVIAAAMRTPPHPLHIPSDDPAVGAALARFVLAHDLPTTGVGGIAGAATGFTEVYAAARKVDVSTQMSLMSYDLPGEPVPPASVAGSARLAGLADLARIDSWMSQFMTEADPDAPPYRSLEAEVRDGRMLLWEAEGSVVSQAFVSPASAGVARISGVYTPAQLRGHGYASALVAALSERVQHAGHRCMLFTDAANPTSSSIYQRIGYRRRGDSVTLKYA